MQTFVTPLFYGWKGSSSGKIVLMQKDKYFLETRWRWEAKFIGGETWSPLKWSVMLNYTKLSIKIEYSVKRFFLTSVIPGSLFNVQRFSCLWMFCYWTELAVSIIPHIISEVSHYHSIHHHLPTNSNWASSPTLALQAQVSSNPLNFKSTGTFKLKVSLLVHQILLFKGGVPSSGVNSHYTLAARVAVQPTFSVFFNCFSKVNQNFDNASIRHSQRQ